MTQFIRRHRPFRSARIPLVLLATVALAPPAARAVSTAYWIHDTADEFLEGEAENVAIASDGTLRLSPELKIIAEPDVPYVWDLVAGTAGEVFLGTGDDGWVLRVHGGKLSNFFQCAALEVLALEYRDGAVWAGTAPEGFVYRIEADGTGKLVFDAEQSYVWDLAFGPDGMLYAGVGPGAAVYRIDPRTGKSEEFFAIEDRHVVCLDFDDQGRLLLGTEGRGLVIRVDPDGTARVLHDCPQGEVGAVLAGADGVVWAAAAASAEAREHASPDTNGDGTGIDHPYSFEFTPPDFGDGVLYRIDANGDAVRFWESGQGAIFDLSLAPNGDVLATTGDTGAIFAVHADGRASLLLDAREEQVVALSADGDAHWVATANPARVMRLGSEPGKEGVYRSQVIDARRRSQWGRLTSIGEAGGGRVTFAVRTGDTEEPDVTWTDWRTLDGEGAIAGDRTRYLQWRATLKGGRPGPEVRQVRVSSLETNLAPVVRDVEVVPAGNRFYDEIPEVRPRPLYQALPGGVKVQYSFDLGGEESLPPERRAPWTLGVRQVRWEALDPNEDPLLFALAFRRDDETEWKEFAEEIEGTNWTFNSRGVPDGEYRVRVTATDRLGNAVGERDASLESEAFTVDNTAPVFCDVKHEWKGDRVSVAARVEDTSSDIVRLEYSINGEDWKDEPPRDGIFDARSERFEIAVDAARGREHSILLRATDLAGNLGTARILLRP